MLYIFLKVLCRLLEQGWIAHFLDGIFVYFLIVIGKSISNSQFADRFLQAHEASLKDSVIVFTSVADSLTSYTEARMFKKKLTTKYLAAGKKMEKFEPTLIFFSLSYK